MNRRNFLAGLLATTAAVPLAKAAPLLPGQLPGEVHLVDNPALFVHKRMVTPIFTDAFDFWKTREVDEVLYGGPTSISMADVMALRDAMDAAPVPEFGRHFLDEETDITADAWDMLTLATREFGDTLPTEPVRLMVPAATEAPQHDATDGDPRPELPRNPRPDRDL